MSSPSPTNLLTAGGLVLNSGETPLAKRPCAFDSVLRLFDRRCSGVALLLCDLVIWSYDRFLEAGPTSSPICDVDGIMQRGY